MRTNSLKNIALVFFVILIGITSCKAPKSFTVEKLRPISTNKLIRNIEDNAFDYKGLGIKKISCQYDNNGNKTSFKANLSSVKDDFILLTLSKINVPVGRLLLTPDSVRMINYLDKNYFLQDYSYLEKFVSSDIDFYTVQSILSSDVFSYSTDNEDDEFKEFVSYTNSGLYVLQSVKNRKLDKITRKGNEDKFDRYMKKMDEEAFVVQYLYIDPETYKVRKIILDDITNERKVQVEFSDYELLEKQLFPGNINIHFSSQDNDLKIKINLSKFSLEYDPDYNFKIPEKYEQVN